MSSTNYNVATGWTSQDMFPRMVADVTGDGRADIVAFGSTATYTSASHDFFVVPAERAEQNKDFFLP